MAEKHTCSNGEKVSQAQINTRYAIARQEKYSGFMIAPMCEAGCGRRGNDSDHTISQSRCKKIHKTELIWHKGNFVWSCRVCHGEWEAKKNPAWLNHANVAERMLFLKIHDPEEYDFRINMCAEVE